MAVQGIKAGDVVADSSFEKLQNGSKITISKMKLPSDVRAMRPTFHESESVSSIHSAAGRNVSVDGRHSAGAAWWPTHSCLSPRCRRWTIRRSQVLTLYPGASPDVMASTVTAPLERQFGEMQGLSQMTSTSAGGVSVIVLQFNLNARHRRRRRRSAVVD